MKIRIYKILDKTLYILFFLIKLSNLWQKKSSKKTIKHNKLMIIKLAAMGDVLALLPTVKQFHRLHPEISITLLTTTRSFPSFYSDIPWLNVVVVDGNIRGVLGMAIKVIFFSSKKVDAIFNFDQYYRVSELISLSCRRNASFETIRLGKFSEITVPYEPNLNEKLMFHKLFEKGIRKIYGFSIGTYEHVQLDELIPKQRMRNKHKFNETIHLAIYPGSSQNAKFRRWPINKYIELIKRLPSTWCITILGGPDEIELRESFKELPNINIMINMMSLSEITQFLHEQVDILVGNDGGLLHVADILHIPTVAIFGPSLGCKWGPQQKISKIVEVDDLECRPCIKNYDGLVPQSCRRNDVYCLETITCEIVVNKIMQLYKEIKC